MTDPIFPAGFEEDDDFDDDSPIQYHCEDLTFDLPSADRITAWILAVVEQEKAQLTGISFIFCSDAYLHELNMQYLQHDTLTDIITFPYSERPYLEGDIFISIDRIRENAQTFGVAFEDELHRVMIHGVLHLCGYSDKSPEEKKLMTEKENDALQLLRKPLAP